MGGIDMHRIIRFFKARGFALLAFHIGVLLFCWPLLSIPAESGGTGLFYYILTAWAVLVIILVCMGESIRRSQTTEEND